jgi:hypothetical protein
VTFIEFGIAFVRFSRVAFGLVLPSASLLEVLPTGDSVLAQEQHRDPAVHRHQRFPTWSKRNRRYHTATARLATADAPQAGEVDARGR